MYTSNKFILTNYAIYHLITKQHPEQWKLLEI